MKKLILLFLTLTLLAGFAGEVNGQVTFFGPVNFGTGAPTGSNADPINTHATGWSSVPELTGGSMVNGGWGANSSSVSTGYSNPTASGANNAAVENRVIGTYPTGAHLISPSINTTNYSNVELKFGRRFSGTSSNPITATVSYSTDGGSTFITTGLTNNVFNWINSSWALVTVTGFPSVSNLILRWTASGSGTAGSQNFRIDDVVLEGISTSINDGDGSATLQNVSGGTFNNTNIFNRNTSGRSVDITVTGVSAGLLDQVRLTVPTDFTGYNSANVSLGGAFAGKSTSMVGNQITVLSAALGTTPGTITISNLTSPNPVGSGLNGNSNWIVETAKSGGTLTPIASSPKSYTIIPISNLKTGGIDGFGNSDAGNTPVMSGNVVAVSGIATMEHQVLNTNSFTSFYIQEGTYGLQVFRSGTPVVTWVRGDQLVLLGTIGQFNGGMQISPFTGSSPNFFNLGAGTMPIPLELTNASNITEQYEGRYIKLMSATFDSAGQTFIASALNRGMNNFRTAPTDTGALFLHGANTSVVGKIIPASADIVAIVHQRNDIIGAGQTRYKLAVRNLADLGIDPANGSGIATISPTSQPVGATSVTETIVLKGDGTNTIAGMSVTIPATWTWTGNSADAVTSGPGFASVSKSVSGNGSVGDPWVITLNGTVVTNVDTGIIAISNLTAPSTTGNTTFIVKTRGVDGTLMSIATQPTVNIYTVTALPFIENFEYTTGSLLTANGWSAHSGTTNFIGVNADPLNYPNYVHSGIGKSVTLKTTGEDVNRSFTTVNSGSVYASFMVKVDTALLGGEYFFHLSPAGNPGTHTARIYFKKESSTSDNIAFGVSKGSATAEYTTFNYVFNTTYLIVLKYTFNTGSTTDDEIKLWINPVLTGIEPVADIIISPSTTDPSSLGIVALRQGSGNATPAITLGGLRINTAWLPSGEASYDVPVTAGWNMVSVPLTVADYTKTVLFPTATSPAFAYIGSYVTQTTLENGIGYWLKFPPSSTSVPMSGLARSTDSVSVLPGWNMIGSLTLPFGTDKITPSSGVVVTSPYYGYNNGYQIATTINPGKAYWVKVSVGGKLYFNLSGGLAKEATEASFNLDGMNSIIITDAVGSSQTLYFGANNNADVGLHYFELPPQSPFGIFDVRFKSQRLVEFHPAVVEKSESFPVSISSAVYPITIEWNIKNVNSTIYQLIESGSENSNAVTLSGSGKVKISDENVKAIQIQVDANGILPHEFSLGQNYPNPFNPSTLFNVALPQNAEVNVDVYDLLGRKLSTIVSGNLTAGNHTFEWNGKADLGYTVPSGIYFIKMTAKGQDNKIFSFVRKATILK